MITITNDYKVKIDKKPTSDTSGTSLRGGIDTSYKSLVDLFGKPNGMWDSYKTDAEWVIETPSGVATIYNYKDGKNYLGEDGLDVEDITDWHIGGYVGTVANWIEGAVKRKQSKKATAITGDNYKISITSELTTELEGIKLIVAGELIELTPEEFIKLCVTVDNIKEKLSNLEDY